MILALYGTGGAGKETICTAEAIQQRDNRWEQILYIDDTKEPGETLGYQRLPYVDFVRLYRTDCTEIHITQGEPAYKEMLAQKVTADGYRLATLIHPAAQIAENVQIGQGVQIKMGAHVFSGCVLGDGAWVQAYSTVRQNVTVGAFSQVSAKAWIGADVSIGHNTFVGMHASVDEGIRIGDYAVISMGASLHQDVGDEDVYMGNPARRMGKNQKHLLF